MGEKYLSGFMTGLTEHKTTEPEEIINHIGETVRIHGSIYKIRKMSDFSFVLLRTKRDILQCIYSAETAGFGEEELKEESCAIVTAKVVEEKRSKTGYDLWMEALEVLTVPEEKSPIVINHKLVDTSIENLLDYRPVTLRNEKQRAIFKLQEGICNGFRQFLLREHFTEIHTPKIVQAGAEGGANIFRLDYFGKEAYLAQSPQFYKQMMVGVFERVFEIAPVFRAEKHDTSRHLNEYTSVDFEMGYIENFTDIMQTETKMLQSAMEYLEGNYAKELKLLQVKIPKTEAIPAIRFREAKELLAREFHRTTEDTVDFEPEEEKLLCRYMQKETGSDFVFVTHYPGQKRPFYAMDGKEDREETESFDLLFRGMEVTTGGQRIDSYEEQIKKMERRGMDTELFGSYLLMHKYGMPPHGGLGLGLERFTGRLLNQENVRFSALFPRDVNRVMP